MPNGRWFLHHPSVLQRALGFACRLLSGLFNVPPSCAPSSVVSASSTTLRRSPSKSQMPRRRLRAVVRLSDRAARDRVAALSKSRALADAVGVQRSFLPPGVASMITCADHDGTTLGLR